MEIRETLQKSSEKMKPLNRPEPVLPGRWESLKRGTALHFAI
jgi:hypothetical protein